MKSIINEILTERNRQDRKYGGAEHDDQHLPEEWRQFIEHRCERLTTSNDVDYRKYLIQIAALAIAATQSIDRLKERNLAASGTKVVNFKPCQAREKVS